MGIHTGIAIFAAFGGIAGGAYGLASSWTEGVLAWYPKRVYRMIDGEPSRLYDLYHCKVKDTYCVSDRLPERCIVSSYTGFDIQMKWITPASDSRCYSAFELYRDDQLALYVTPFYAMLLISSLFALCILFRTAREEQQTEQN